MFLRLVFLIVSLGMAFAVKSDNASALIPVEPYRTSLLQFSLAGTTNEPVWKNLRDAVIVASSSLNQYSLPTNLKGVHHNVWVSATDLAQWLTFSFEHTQTIDGIRVWNVMTNTYSFLKYEFQMSPNDGHDWYGIKKGDGNKQTCCDYQEILFPVAHAKMFKLKMDDNHGTATGSNPTSLSYVEFHFLPEPDYICPYYAVPYNNFCYAVMDRALYGSTDLFCTGDNKLPIGWHLAPYSADVVSNVVWSAFKDTTQAHWGTDYIVFEDGTGYSTIDGTQWKMTRDDSSPLDISNAYDATQTTNVYRSTYCDAADGSVNLNDGTNTWTCDLNEAGHVAISSSCTSKLLMQMAQNSTRRWTPPFVSRKDTNNNMVFEMIN